MSEWRLFWTLVGYVAFIVILIFLYFYKPFEDLFTLVINGLGYDNAIFWVVLIAASSGFADIIGGPIVSILCSGAASTAWCSLRCAARPSSQFSYAPAPRRNPCKFFAFTCCRTSIRSTPSSAPVSAPSSRW